MPIAQFSVAFNEIKLLQKKCVRASFYTVAAHVALYKTNNKHKTNMQKTTQQITVQLQDALQKHAAAKVAAANAHKAIRALAAANAAVKQLQADLLAAVTASK